MAEFDLTLDETIRFIDHTVTNISKHIQLSYQKYGQSVFLIKNKPLMDAAIKNASQSVLLHGALPNEVDNVRKYAHLCFWMQKLHPITYITGSAFLPIAARIVSIILPNERFYEVKGLSDNVGHIPVSAEAAYYTFLMLYCIEEYTGDDINKNFNQLINSAYTEEIISSFMNHNYSARSMSMFLETLMMDRLK